MITRRARIQRSASIRKRRAIRRGPWRCEKYRRWVATHPCIICGDERTQAAHTVNNGRSSKGPDSSCIPLCPFHHDQMDGRRDMGGRYGKPSFVREHNVNLAEIADGLFAAWRVLHNPEPPCECEVSGDQADAARCDLHNPNSKFNRMRPEMPRVLEVSRENENCPF